jgi:hypothetical protein
VSIPEDPHRLSQGAAARSPAAALGSSSSRSASIPQTCTLPLAAVLGICDILVQIRIRIPDPYLWLMDPDPAPFFNDFKDVKKKYFFPIFFL